MLSNDVHQHLWTEPLIAALAARRSAPRVRREERGWQLELVGEPLSLVPAETPSARAATVRADGIDRALIALSSALGVELLAPEEAAPLLAAHAGLATDRALVRAGRPVGADAGAASADAEAESADDRPGSAARPEPARLGIWAATSLADPAEAARELPAALTHAAGLCLPAGPLATPAGVERVAPLLAALEAADRPLFVHPGPAAAPDGAPAWWPALADYVAQLQAAWLAFAVAGRPAHPSLRVVFAALAGLAPLHAERIAARGGPGGAAADPLVFYDSSSYGPAAFDAMAARVGLAQLVHGTDRPVVRPARSPVAGAAWSAIATFNPARLLAPDDPDKESR